MEKCKNVKKNKVKRIAIIDLECEAAAWTYG